MKNEITISVYEVVGYHYCATQTDGQMVFDRIYKALNNGVKVKVDFHNVSSVTPTFLNAAIGQLYGHFGTDRILTFLTVENMNQDDMALLKRVVETAKDYFKG